MRRKIVKHGSSTLTVSLPSKWAKKYGIEAGDDIDLTEEGNRIIISKSRLPIKKEITIEIKSEKQFLKRFLVGPYIKGYDLITVRYKDPKIYFKIQDTVTKLLLGFEIIDSEKNKCVLKNMAESVDTEFDSNNKKFFIKVKYVLNSLIDAIDDKNMDDIDNILIIDANIDRLNLFLRRILNTKGYHDDAKKNTLYYVINILETISDNCREICKHIKKSDEFPRRNVTAILRETAKNMDLCYELFYKFDRDKLADLKRTNKFVKTKAFEILCEKDSEFKFYPYILNIILLQHNLSEELE